MIATHLTSRINAGEGIPMVTFSVFSLAALDLRLIYPQAMSIFLENNILFTTDNFIFE